MKARNILAIVLLWVAGLQMAQAQKVVLYMDNHQPFECDVQHLDSIVFIEAEARLVTGIVLSKTSLTLQPGDSEILTATVLPENAENKVVSWVSSNPAVAVVANNGTVVALSVGNCVITCSATDGSGVKAECQVTVGDSTPDEHEYVDLGLPSHTLWATCNVGADSPEEYGDYFAWGETEPKMTYGWSTYKYCKGDYHQLTKYCTQSEYGYNGFTDTLTELEAEDDAATANWGSGWQMPNHEQMEELINRSYTTTTSTTQNGVSGRKITGKNGKSIFLPAAGYIGEKSGKTTKDEAGISGCYWSRSLDTSCSFGAYYLGYAPLSTSDIARGRYGFSVRPVRVGALKLVTEVHLNYFSLTLKPNESKQLTATIEPLDADNKAVTWESSDESIATVDQSGRVTANANGTCVITCSATDGSGVKAECPVIVNAGDEQTFTVGRVTFKMKKVDGGTFTMGATAEQSNGYTPDSDEKPTHLVTLSDYWMGETEVTQALWYAVMGTKPTSGGVWSSTWSTTYGLGDNYPTYFVSWYDCRKFITKLNQLTGQTFRLPTEAEWEFAARGGNKSQGYIFSGSNTIDDVAWCTENSSLTTHAVATKAPNELGIYDMSGNVWEWCQDWYGDYSSGSQTNPTGPSSDYHDYRVNRGGSWDYSATYCRVANRSSYDPTSTDYYLGLRLAL